MRWSSPSGQGVRFASSQFPADPVHMASSRLIRTESSFYGGLGGLNSSDQVLISSSRTSLPQSHARFMPSECIEISPVSLRERRHVLGRVWCSVIGA